MAASLFYLVYRYHGSGGSLKFVHEPVGSKDAALVTQYRDGKDLYALLAWDAKKSKFVTLEFRLVIEDVILKEFLTYVERLGGSSPIRDSFDEL